MSKIKYINLADLHLPDFQAHRNISQEHIRELSESIKLIGIIEPLIVINTDQGIEIVAGTLRYRASILSGLKAVPCIFMTLDPKSAEILKLHENVKRIPLDHIDQGMTFIMMMKEFKMTEKSISECVGKSISYISQHVSLVRIDNELTQAVKNNLIPFSHSRELMRINDPEERNRLLSFCINDGATLQVLQRWVQESLRSLPSEAISTPEIPDSSLEHNNPHISRFCEACGKSVEISKIRQVFYCPVCHHNIKNAISEERNKLSSETPEKD
ncbi:MAG: ParB/RepB/Spo0J family partition protein [Bacteroidetes bacterium]|nr:ParB/RepB/Spo0J family partition protein [Bacteroidota bacterium]